MPRPSWTIVWGWTASGESVWRESFEDRRLCWERVKVIMGVLEAAGDDAERVAGKAKKRVPVLQVWSGESVTTFRQYEVGSRFCQWGRWGAFSMAKAERGGVGG